MHIIIEVNIMVVILIYQKQREQNVLFIDYHSVMTKILEVCVIDLIDYYSLPIQLKDKVPCRRALWLHVQ